MFTSRGLITEYDCNLLNRNIQRADGCWLWKGSHSSGGYPSMHRTNSYGKVTTVSRMLCEYFYGPPRTNSVAMHSCNNPRCVNPYHLKWGTQKQNIKQAYLDGNRLPVPLYTEMKERRLKENS